MRLAWSCLLVFLAATLAAQQPPPPPGDASIFHPPDDPKARLPYRLVRPVNAAPGQKFPLILCLHGAGSRGTDNAKHLVGFRSLLEEEARSKHPAFLVFPQVPPNATWATYGWSHATDSMAEAPNPVLANARALVAELISKESVDPDRVYVTGMSMGGYGTWEAIQRWPELFAAAVPICGGGDVAHAKRLVAMPIWAFHGARDTTIKADRTERAVAAIRAAGGKPRFTLYPAVGHEAWWPAYQEPDLLTWLFAQRRSRPSPGAP